MTVTNSPKNNFLKEWVVFNLLGWFIGMIIGPALLITISINSYLRNFSDLAPIFFSFPFGIGLGIMQQIKLRRWKISSSSWVLATAFGFGIPATLISWLLNLDLLNYRVSSFLQIAEIAIIGASVGGLQAFLLHKSVLKTRYWVLTYIFGLSSLAITAIVIYIIPVVILAKPILRFLKEYQELWFIISNREILLLSFMGIILPFLATLFIGLPTGVILQKFGNIQIASEDKKPPKENFEKTTEAG